MANNIIKRVWNQGSMTPIEDLQGSAFTNENGGHTFQISGVDSNGEALALSGTVAASFLRPDQTSVGITGSVSGGVASVTLSAECYGIPGRFGLVIFLTSDGKKTAIYSCVGNVARSSTDAVAPGVVADVVDLINEIQAAVDTIPASYSALMADIAPTYSSSALYAVGDYAWYEGDLKRCIVPITVGETYTPAHWTSAVVGDDVCALKSALNSLDGEIFTTTEKTLEQRANLKRLNPANGGWGSAHGYKIMSCPVAVGDLVRIEADDRWQFQSVASDGYRIGETYEAGTYNVVVPETVAFVVLSTPFESNAHVYSVSSRIDEIENRFGNAIEAQQEEIEQKLDKGELDTEGISVTVPDVEYGVWANVNVGDTITPATNNNCRRVILDLSTYIGWEVEIALDTTINPQTTSGTRMYLADSDAVAAVVFTEQSFAYGATYKYTVTESTAYAYLSYATARSSSNFTAKAVSPLAIQFGKIDKLEEEMTKTIKPISFENLCKNPDIDDLTGFSVNSVATISAEDNVLTITPTARNSETDYTMPTPIQNGHVYYAAAYVKSNYTGNGLMARLMAFRSGQTTLSIGGKNYNGDNPDAWQRLSFVTTQAPDYTTIRFRIFCNSTGLEVIYVKQIVVLDLTEIFGAGNEPSAGAVEEIISAANSGSAFFIDTLTTNTILAQPYPNSANNKPMFVGISGYVMNVNAKYSANKDIQYRIGKAGSNSLFNWRGFGFIDNTSPIVSPEVDLTQNITVITDWFGPHKLRAANNIDGDMPDSDNFTGGNHAYNGDSSGTPTARTVSYAYYVDGRKVDSFLGYAYYVDVYWENRVQATNTKKADGTGREVLKETFHMHFDGDKWTLDGMLEPLEALSSWSYYGIQMSRASAYNGYIFYHDSPDNRTWHSTRAASNSGTDKCRTITMHDGADYFEMHVGTDGLGDFALNRQENSFFSTDSKTYSHLVKNASDIGANSVFTYCGWYKWYNQDFS